MCDLDGIFSKHLIIKNQPSFSKENSKHLTQEFWTSYLQLEMDRSLSSSSEVQEVSRYFGSFENYFPIY